jgi:hypothetical protein
LVNRVDPVLFGRFFESWIKELWPNRHDLIAIDGKPSRRTHDKREGLKARHTLSAYASNAWHPGEPRFTHIKTIVKIDLLTEYPDQSTTS